MSGFELLSVVRRRFPVIAVIAMSGAHSGVFVPSGVAADAFYAKGSNGAARLFEILWSIEDRDSRESLRASVPIWIPNLSAHECGGSAVAVSCPECLRAFFNPVSRGKGSTYLTSCPHCFYPVNWQSPRNPARWIQLLSGCTEVLASLESQSMGTECMSDLVGQ